MNLVERIMAAVASKWMPGQTLPEGSWPTASSPPPKIEEPPVLITSLGSEVTPQPSQYSVGFRVAINRVLGSEGGLSNDPNDPGKLTQWGISQRAYPNIDIRALTRDAAVAIFYRDYWLVISAEKMPPALAYQALDFAIHSGPSTAIKKLQTIVKVTADGQFGPNTATAISATPLTTLLLEFIGARLDFLRQTPVWKSDASGLAARIAKVMHYAALDL